MSASIAAWGYVKIWPHYVYYNQLWALAASFFLKLHPKSVLATPSCADNSPGFRGLLFFFDLFFQFLLPCEWNIVELRSDEMLKSVKSVDVIGWNGRCFIPSIPNMWRPRHLSPAPAWHSLLWALEHKMWNSKAKQLWMFFGTLNAESANAKPRFPHVICVFLVRIVFLLNVLPRAQQTWNPIEIQNYRLITGVFFS